MNPPAPSSPPRPKRARRISPASTPLNTQQTHSQSNPPNVTRHRPHSASPSPLNEPFIPSPHGKSGPISHVDEVIKEHSKGRTLEEEKIWLENEEDKLEQEKKKLEEEQKKLEEEKKKLEEKKKKLEEEKKTQEVEKKTLEEEKKTLETKEEDLISLFRVARAQQQTDLVHDLSEDLQLVRRKIDASQKTTESHQKTIESHQKTIESHQKTIESHTKTMEFNQLYQLELQKQNTTVLRIKEKLTPSTDARSTNKFGYEYVRNDNMTRFANELKKGNFVKLDAGVEIIRLLPTEMIPVLSDTTPPVLVTRTHSRGCCRAAVQLALSSGPGSRIVINGPPGIGKSWHIFYMLYLLMNEGREILVASRENDTFSRFLRMEDGSYIIESCKCANKGPAIHCEKHVIVILDPTEFGNDINFVDGVLILVASTHSKHYYNWSKDGMTRFFMPMITLSELLVSKLYFHMNNINDEILRTRFLYVGGAPRYIFDEQKFHERKQQLENSSYKGLSRWKVDYILSCSSPSEIMEDQKQSLSTTFVKYSIRIDEGGDPDYKRADIEFVSHYAMVRLLKHVVDVAFEAIVCEKDRSMGAYHGARFEDIVCTHLMEGGRFEKKNVQRGKRTRRVSFELEHARVEYISSQVDMIRIIQGGLKRARSKVKDSDEHVIYVAPPNFPTCDFVDSYGRLYNATISSKHALSNVSLRSLLGSLDVRKGEQLQQHWCIPEGQSFSAAEVDQDLISKLCQFAMWIPREFKET